MVWVPLQPFRAWPFISGGTSKRKEVDSYLLFPMRDMLYTWRCIPENLKLSSYVIFSYFSVCLFVCLYRATMLEQCNNNLTHLSKYLLPLKITVVDFFLCNIALKIFITNFADVLIPDVLLVQIPDYSHFLCVKYRQQQKNQPINSMSHFINGSLKEDTI